MSQTLTLSKSFVFCDITPYNPLNVNRHFGGTYFLYLQGLRISQARNNYEAINKQSNRCVNLKKCICSFFTCAIFMVTICQQWHMCHVLITILQSIPYNVSLGTVYFLKTRTKCEAGFEGLNAVLNIKLTWKIICLIRFPVFSLLGC
jgi:hypothetical protein